MQWIYFKIVILNFLDGLRLLVEKSELWVYKSKSADEQQKVVNSVNSSKNKSQVKKPSNFMVNGSSIKEEDENATDERHPSPEAEDEAIGNTHDNFVH